MKHRIKPQVILSPALWLRAEMTASTSTTRVGVLSLHNSKETKAICNAIEALGHHPEWLREENTSIEVTRGEAVLNPNVDIVVNRLLLSNSEQPCEDLGLAKTISSIRPMLNEPEGTLPAVHKFATATALIEADLPVPDALLALNSATLDEGRYQFGPEVVYKTAIGTHGGGTWKVSAEEPVMPKVGYRRAFMQELIQSDDERPRDVRVYVVGDRAIGAMTRYAPDKDWRTNVALGGDVIDATELLGTEVEEIAIRATSCLGLDYAGIDMVEGANGWQILEVNPTAGFRGFFKATGISPAPAIAALAIEQVGGTVDHGDVTALSEQFDDSVPSCRPMPRPAPTTETIASVGLTEEILVTGTTGTERIIAKSDTGAKRTSIDTKLAAKVGAGPIKEIARVKSGSRKTAVTRPVVDIVVGVGGTRHTVTASVEDRSHMEYPVILGRDVLQHYRVDVSRSVEDSRSEQPETEE